MSETSTGTAATPNRKPFYLVLALFAAPLALAFLVYYGSDWRPVGSTNKGQLISPAVPLPSVTLNKPDGTQTDAEFMRRTWTLVHIDAGDCATACRNALLATRNARELLGKDMPRVSRVLLYTGTTVDVTHLQSEHQDLVAASIASNEGQSLLKLFPAAGGVPAPYAGRTYIVDPLGNLMMRYVPDTNPRDIYQDLKKLLKLSHIG